MFSTSISAAAAEAHINDLLAEATTARHVRLARRANAARRAESHCRQPNLRTNRIPVIAQVTLAAVRCFLAAHRPRRVSRTVVAAVPGEGDAR